MKHMKKLFGLLLAVVMVFAMSVSVFADATVTVNGNDGILKNHTFTAYQIVSGTVNKGVLTDPKWGNGIEKTGFLTALQTDPQTKAKFEQCKDEDTFVKVLSENSGLAEAVAKLAYNNKTGTGTPLSADSVSLEEGYYLIVDTTDKDELAAGSAYNAALLRVVGDVTIDVKTDAPEVEKKVKENTKYTKNETSSNEYQYGMGYNDVADYNIGDDVPFSFYSKVPDMSKFDTYKYVFHDTMSAGLTLNVESISVTIGEKQLAKNQFEVKTSGTEPGCTFEVEIENLKDASLEAAAGKLVRVDFTAKLNKEAVIGQPGNPNEVHLEYSSNPNESKETNNTPIDKVIVFTYELDVTKIDGATKEELKGAKFKLRVKDGKWVKVDADQKVDGWTDNEAEASELTSDENGIFKIIGLDDGTYLLRETAAPDKYNLLKNDIEVVLKTTTINGQQWDSTKTASDALTNIQVTADNQPGTGNTQNGTASITVANNKGGSLPSTGGIGTTIFYVVGGILMAVAAILLITKKKMSNK